MKAAETYVEVALVKRDWGHSAKWRLPKNLYQKGDRYYVFKSEEIPADSVSSVIQTLQDILKMDPSAFLSYEYNTESEPYEPSERLFINYYDDVTDEKRIQTIIKKLK